MAPREVFRTAQEIREELAAVKDMIVENQRRLLEAPRPAVEELERRREEDAFVLAMAAAEECLRRIEEALEELLEFGGDGPENWEYEIWLREEPPAAEMKESPAAM